MNAENQKNITDDGTPEWLENLQQESWQAEILISGGAFIGVISALDVLPSFFNTLEYSAKISHSVASFIFAPTAILLIFLFEGFLLHLLLRGYWIGLIGINYVFPDGINKEELAFKGKFSHLIKNRSNTPFIIGLDKFCGLVFSFTFFVIFSTLGFLLWIGIMVIITKVTDSSDHPEQSIIFWSLIGMGFLVLLDFLTFGRMKRVKWFSMVYYPIHFLVSILTLSFIYRRLYYTIVSNIKGLYIYIFFILQVGILVFYIAGGQNFPLLAGSFNSSGANSFLVLKENVVSGKSLQFSITHMPQLQEEIIDNWSRENLKSKVSNFHRLKPKEQLKIIGDAYEVFIDTIQIKNIQWMAQQEINYSNLEITKLISLVDISEFARGSHEFFVRIRSKQKYDIDSRNPQGNYYAKTYFFVDK